jgi:predicted nucleic acid-binding protein
MIFGRFKGRQGEHYLDRILDVIKLPRFVVEEITPERFQQTIAMRRRYKDKPDISFTDLTSMVLMRELKIQEIFTADLHFAKVNLGFRLVPGL